MTLTSRTRLGAYEVLSLIGQGGMGEVYRAKDLKLGREVALKILPATFTNDPDRVARFRREAQVLASLNHPHIAQIHGLDEVDGIQFLVLELVDGESLDKRIACGRIPLEESLAIAKQIAEALEAAHEQGIIQRDLKPANIALTGDGQVKVLDFGLAKAVETTASQSNLSMSPTITTPAMMTGVGVILGTAAYMSPEQAKGRPADKRSDIWAFGCVLYEMLTGTRTFNGDDVGDTLAMVLKGTPDWAALPEDLPPQIRPLLRGCLEKDRATRVSDISTARFLITQPPAATVTGLVADPPRGRARWTRALSTAASAIAGGVFVAVVFSSIRRVPSPQPVTRFTYRLGEGDAYSSLGQHLLAISLDGTETAYVANRRLYVKPAKDVEATAISGSELRQGPSEPAFSPDGRSLVFWSADDRTLKRIATTGGTPVTLCKAENPFGMSWEGDAIFLGQGSNGISRVPATGGTPETVIRVQDNEQAQGPQLLPDRQSLVYTLARGNDPERWDKAEIVVQRLGSAERKTIATGGADARYVQSGHIVYATGGVLFAVPFDLRRLEVVGGPTAIVEGVARSTGTTGAADFAISQTGTLVYVAGPASTRASRLDLALLDRKGSVDRLRLPPHPYQVPRMSPGGRQLAVGVDDGMEANVWVYDLSGASSIRRLTFGGKNRFPEWTADGARIAFQSDREGDAAIFWQRADGTGTAERITKPDQGHVHVPIAWSPKSDILLFDDIDGSHAALWTFSIRERKAAPFAAVRSSYPSNFLPTARFSPDGQWVAYSSDETESQTTTIFVQPFPATGAKFQIGNGITPLWGPAGKELFFSPGIPGLPFLAVSVETQPTFRFGNPISVPRPGALVVGGIPGNYDIAPDGQHFIIVVDAGDSPTRSAVPQIQVVLNWFEELKVRAPAK